MTPAGVEFCQKCGNASGSLEMHLRDEIRNQEFQRECRVGGVREVEGSLLGGAS